MDRRNPSGVGEGNGSSLPDTENPIAATSEQAVFSLDPQGLVRSWNDQAAKIEGYSGEEVIGQHFSVFSPQDQVAAGRPEWELTQAIRAGFYLDQGWRLRKDGSRFWAHIAITTQRSNDGSLYGFITVIRDESEKRARHQRSTRRFTDLFDLAPVGIGLFDESDRLLHANNALCELLGYGLDELHGMSGSELLLSEDPAEGIIPKSPTSLSPHEHAPVSQRRLIRSDGRQLTCEVHSAVSTEDNGNPFWQVVFQDVTEQRRHTDMLQHRATHDELTGLPNRSGISERLDELLGHGDLDQIAVLFCDLDNFKRVNDSLGHEAGDELLVALARRLTTGLPPACTAARLFGDEYLIICSDLDAVGGLEKLTTLTLNLLHTVVPVRGQLVTASASVGAAVITAPGTTGEDLLRFADAAMFTAKSHSPGSVSIANRELIDSLGQQVQLEGQLRDAIHNDRLTLQYQPIVDCDGSVLMAEALVRWPHPHRGLLSPGIIMPVAEQGNLLGQLDRWVLSTALREAANWPTVSGRPVRVAVNLSRLLPDDEHFLSEVSGILEESGIDGSRVVLEVVESSLGDLTERPRADMAELAEQGVWFAVDDFGTGYSSLKRLRDLPTHVLKIDRAFVSGVEHDPADFAIVRAVVEMSLGMKRHCVAEGVETAEQFRMLKSLGVDAFQGFLFSASIPAADFRALLEQGSVPVPEES
ncbi:PAS domain S-box-containing protein/diguanylate cyclase (GGDEF)-like protein [Halopolyspora algeriensis]|uniref:PAS domain S-box-containing protein/diguanylate cyclase (GGDEF)-like protein n=1 Tax=Halopolyspora algeriensis TaxID=1500506 RepID=A0A368VX19_9ACTN|nr:bifunctional diguanylate cyclase/phosphodiesterase [Halopolyspora algeriensis]RCW45900.1 PAS domain S-box-containing protein/diguanylate cyclase (GGDEF)-like protein [Halopolyspora algeriensis]TQM55314.1 PAS domain S-box-containing protein/diguanylate cyclase (GGDEF)-like protein [Halopolyspora algeriensis]